MIVILLETSLLLYIVDNLYCEVRGDRITRGCGRGEYLLGYQNKISVKMCINMRKNHIHILKFNIKGNIGVDLSLLLCSTRDPA